MITDDVVEGHTGPIPYQIIANGEPVPLTGMTVTAVVKDRASATVDTTGDVAVTDAPTGMVSFNPGTADLVASKSPYTLRFKVTDGAGKIVYFPSADPVRLNVNTP